MNDESFPPRQILLSRGCLILGLAAVAVLLVGLLVVGLVQMRGKSELTVCTNNLRRIGQAVSLYYEDQEPRHFPPGTILNADLPPDRRLSWMVAILPYMATEPSPEPVTAKAPGVYTRAEALYARFDRT